MLTWLADTLRAAGLTVHELKGWEERCRPGPFMPRAIIVHHDASAVGPSNYEPEFIGIQGRPAEGIPAPLAQLWVAKNGDWWVLAAGRANQAGKGQGWGAIPPNMGNTYSIGVEWDHTTGEQVTDVEYRSLVTGVAALAKRMGINPANAVCGHKEYARGRKTDPDIDMQAFRKAVAAGPQEDELPSVSDILNAKVVYGNDSITVSQALGRAALWSQRANDKADALEATVAAQAAAIKTLAQSVGVEADKVEAAINKAVAEALDNVTVTLTTGKA